MNEQGHNSETLGIFQFTPDATYLMQGEKGPLIAMNFQELKTNFFALTGDGDKPIILSNRVPPKCKLAQRDLTPIQNTQAMVLAERATIIDEKNPDNNRTALIVVLFGAISNLCWQCPETGNCHPFKNYLHERAKRN